MILVDTSIWIAHLRVADETLQALLHNQRVLTHPFVIGELALGRWPQRDLFLADLHDIPRATMASDAEVMRFIDQADLAGRGIGYIDAHLLASARLTAGASLWTADRRLARLADQLNLTAALGD